MPYKDFADLEVLYASDVDTFLMRQAVMVFDNASARSSALGTAVVEGMVTYIKSPAGLQYYTGSAWADVANPGDITAVTAGTALSGGGSSGSVTLNVNMAALAINATQVATTQTNSTATAYTFGTADQNTLVRFTSASTVTATVSTATALTAGQRIDVLRDGEGQVNITAGSGVTLAGAGTAASAFSIVRYEAASIVCVGSNDYRVIGNVTAI
ncbi:MAG: hypothetical protein EBS38_02695 [Actinobacteria bacterium]|nr:hypothetical protein [Actinomycetota bacterium]